MICYVCGKLFGSGERLEVDRGWFCFYSINPIIRCTIQIHHPTRHGCFRIDTIIICYRILLNSQNSNIFHHPVVWVKNITNTEHLCRIIPGSSSFHIYKSVKWVGVAGSRNSCFFRLNDAYRGWLIYVLARQMLHLHHNPNFPIEKHRPCSVYLIAEASNGP